MRAKVVFMAPVNWPHVTAIKRAGSSRRGRPFPAFFQFALRRIRVTGRMDVRCARERVLQGRSVLDEHEA